MTITQERSHVSVPVPVSVPTGTPDRAYPLYTPVRINPDTMTYGVSNLAADELMGTVADTGVTGGERWYLVDTAGGTTLVVPAAAVSPVEPCDLCETTGVAWGATCPCQLGTVGGGPVTRAKVKQGLLAAYSVELRTGVIRRHPTTGEPVYGWRVLEQAHARVLKANAWGLDQLVDWLAEHWRCDGDVIRVGASITDPAGRELHALKEVSADEE